MPNILSNDDDDNDDDNNNNGNHSIRSFKAHSIIYYMKENSKHENI